MNRWIKRIRAWRFQRQQRAVERWETVMARGKARFILRSALTFTVIMVSSMGIVDYLFDGRIRFRTFLTES